MTRHQIVFMLIVPFEDSSLVLTCKRPPERILLDGWSQANGCFVRVVVRRVFHHDGHVVHDAKHTDHGKSMYIEFCVVVKSDYLFAQLNSHRLNAARLFNILANSYELLSPWLVTTWMASRIRKISKPSLNVPTYIVTWRTGKAQLLDINKTLTLVTFSAMSRQRDHPDTSKAESAVQIRGRGGEDWKSSFGFPGGRNGDEQDGQMQQWHTYIWPIVVKEQIIAVRLIPLRLVAIQASTLHNGKPFEDVISKRLLDSTAPLDKDDLHRFRDRGPTESKSRLHETFLAFLCQLPIFGTRIPAIIFEERLRGQDGRSTRNSYVAT
ncbi:hypothetical protein HG530_009442 [Fusarium avenaceum]|nr:hypothetical protein HG530_009442 [Fusarium avenaceum]